MRLHTLLASIAAPFIAACGGTTSTVADTPVHASQRSVSLDGGFTVRAAARVLPGYHENVVRVSVIVANNGAARSTLEIAGGCPVLMRAYRENAATAALDESDTECTLPLLLLHLDPGKVDTLNRDVNVPRIAPPGTTRASYRIEALFAAKARDHRGRYVLDAGTVTIP